VLPRVTVRALVAGVDARHHRIKRVVFVGTHDQAFSAMRSMSTRPAPLQQRHPPGGQRSSEPEPLQSGQGSVRRADG